MSYLLPSDYFIMPHRPHRQPGQNTECLNSSSTTPRGTLGRLFSLSGFRQAHLWMVMTRFTSQAVVRMGLASRVCDLHSCKGPCAQKGPPFGLMLCRCHIEMCNNFIFELVFCKWSPMGQWGLSRQDSAVCVFAILATPFACSVCTWAKNSSGMMAGNSGRLKMNTR